MKRALFIDKDGTLVQDVAFNADPARLKIATEVFPGLKHVQDAGFLIVVVSNQPGVALGLFQESALSQVEYELRLLLSKEEVSLEGFYYCPHHPSSTIPEYSATCLCRKPSPGLLLAAARDLDISLSDSWMVGDILDDVEAGRRAGCRTILVDRGGETEWRLDEQLRQPDFILSSVNEACRRVLEVSP
jgi:D-glycero-D-manno-heptose 1,7-bisphosphate phosphatase